MASYRQQSLLQAVLFGLLVVALPARSAETAADLELKPGFVDPASGIKVEEVVVQPTSEVQEVHLAVPVATGQAEEIVVMGRRPDRKTLVEVLQQTPHRWVKDYDSNYYGLVLYLGSKETLPIRLYLDPEQQKPGAIQP
jgi:hypothetical protein